MLEYLFEFDFTVFFFINAKMANGFFDLIMPLLRNKYFWAPLYMFFFAFFIKNYGLQGGLVIVGIILTIVLTDQLSSSIIKPLIDRLRPCNNPDLAGIVRMVVPCGPAPSFPSSHAANHFGLAAVLAGLLYSRFHWAGWVGYSMAVLVSLAQVYVGVHYPLDVIGGGLIGIFLGYFISFMIKRTVNFSP